MKKSAWIIGIDEVGRGSLAGPVVVCALAIPRGLRLCPELVEGLPKLRDSKKLSASQRERWAAWVKTQPDIRYMVARVYPRGIERMNISQAANLAATRACVRLAISHKPLANSRVRVLLDGGLYLKWSNVNSQMSNVHTRTVVRGDERYTAIKLASIVAKVARDKFMNKLHECYPRYGFATHKGYGTKRHIAAIKKFGPSEIHRATFVKNFILASISRPLCGGVTNRS